MLLRGLTLRKEASNLRHMTNLMKYSGLFLILVFVSGCSTKVSLINQPQLLHFSTPETSGGWGNGHVSVSLASGESKYLFGSVDSLDPTSLNVTNSTKESIERTGGRLDLNLWVGLLENLDVFIIPKGGAGETVGIKIQLLGSPHSAKEEGYKLSVEARYSSIHETDTGGTNIGTVFIDSLFGGNTPTADINTNAKSSDFSANIGYRYNPNDLIYFNTFINNNSFSGELSYDALGIYRAVATSSKSFGALLGYHYTTDANGFFNAEIGLAKTSWDNRGSVTATPVGISWGRNW